MAFVPQSRRGAPPRFDLVSVPPNHQRHVVNARSLQSRCDMPDMGRPPMGWRTLLSDDFMRVLSPAARTTARQVRVMDVMGSGRFTCGPSSRPRAQLQNLQEATFKAPSSEMSPITPSTKKSIDSRTLSAAVSFFLSQVLASLRPYRSGKAEANHLRSSLAGLGEFHTSTGCSDKAW